MLLLRLLQAVHNQGDVWLEGEEHAVYWHQSGPSFHYMQHIYSIGYTGDEMAFRLWRTYADGVSVIMCDWELDSCRIFGRPPLDDNGLADLVREVLLAYSEEESWLPPCLYHAAAVCGHTLTTTFVEIDVEGWDSI